MTGIFIAFEGIEGCGKSTQIQLLAEHLRGQGQDVVLVREPGGTPIGDRIRALLLDPEAGEMHDTAEMLLFAASRAQLVRQVLRPSLQAGRTVLADRYVTSSIVYQGHARGLGRAPVAEINTPAIDGLLPRRVVVLDLPVQVALRRARDRAALDRIEASGVDFHRSVRRGFLDEAALDPDRFTVVDADGSPEEVHKRVLRALEGALS